MQNKKKKKKSRPEPSLLGAAVAAPRGMIVFLLSAIVTSLPASLAAYLTDDPGQYILPCGLIALYASAVAGGFAAYKFHGGLALPTGFFCGIGCMVISLLPALATPVGSNPQPSPSSVILTRLPLLAMGIIGAYLASTKRKKRKRRR